MGIWFATAQALPCEDEAVRFVVGERSVPLHGQFHDGAFATRWWRYAAHEVCNWCALGAGPSPHGIGGSERNLPLPTASPRVFADMLGAEHQT